LTQFWDDISSSYDKHIQAPGKETHFLILLAFVCSFGFIRGSAHMIRAQVSWWPGNVETKSGTHVHHLVWGILLLITMGYIGISTELGDPWFEFVSVAFGIGLGLTMDEFALWLNLEDVYWQEKGRESIDAVVVTTLLLLVALVGLSFWIDVWRATVVLSGFDRDNGLWIAVLIQLLGIGLGAIALTKGRTLLGISGMFVPLLGLIGALLPARPGSRWARRREHSTA
jgi:hypothetical protein